MGRFRVARRTGPPLALLISGNGLREERMNTMQMQRRIGTLQARWQAECKVLGEQLDLGEGQAPDEVVANENATWEAYKQACAEAGICVRVDCYLTITYNSQRRADVLCSKHGEEWDAWERSGREL